MSEAIAFDTHRFVKRLMQTGVIVGLMFGFMKLFMGA